METTSCLTNPQGQPRLSSCRILGRLLRQSLRRNRSAKRWQAWARSPICSTLQP